MEQSAKGTAAFRGRSLRIALATGGASLLVGAGIAAGQGGGVGAPDPPQVDDVLCRQGCLGLRVATVGATVELSGRNLRNVTRVSFKGSEGRVHASPAIARGRRVEVKVPEGAATGRLAVRDDFGGRSRTSEKLKIRAATLQDPGDFQVTEASAKPAKGFFDGKRRVKFNYLITGSEPVDVRIDVVKNGSGKLIDSISEQGQEPGAVQSVRWKGLRSNGRVAPDGKYRFLVGPESGGLDDEGDEATKFRHYRHKFPVRAKRHDYGDGLGAGRGHQGQDVFGRCGTKIVAARGGKVTWRQYQSAAGYYLVIDGKRTKKNYVYMHLAQRGRPRLGTRVRTGETIGFMSDTGNASGCHLHFELWKGPWQRRGGEVLDPTRPLKRWDRWS